MWNESMVVPGFSALVGSGRGLIIAVIGRGLHAKVLL